MLALAYYKVTYKDKWQEGEELPEVVRKQAQKLVPVLQQAIKVCPGAPRQPASPALYYEGLLCSSASSCR